MDENYIVRIYRRALTGDSKTDKKAVDKADAEALVGVVEEAVSGQRYPFHNIQELMTILKTPHRHSD